MFIKLASVVMVVLIVQTASANQKEKMVCKGKEIKWDKMKKALATCSGKLMGGTTPKPGGGADAKAALMKLFKEKQSCLMVCILEEEKILKSDGSYDKTIAHKALDEMLSVVDKATKDAAKKAFDDCAAAHSKSFSMEKNCHGYDAFLKCKREKFAEVCK